VSIKIFSPLAALEGTENTAGRNPQILSILYIHANYIFVCWMNQQGGVLADWSGVQGSRVLGGGTSFQKKDRPPKGQREGFP